MPTGLTAMLANAVVAGTGGGKFRQATTLSILPSPKRKGLPKRWPESKISVVRGEGFEPPTPAV